MESNNECVGGNISKYIEIKVNATRCPDDRFSGQFRRVDPAGVSVEEIGVVNLKTQHLTR